jgi:3-oxoacyl-[acyl-carrier protein] reductase
MKNYLITGVSRGLGLEIAKIIIANGDFVFGISRTSTPELDTLIEQNPNSIKHLKLDLSDANNVKDEIFKEFIGFKTPLHGYVNNAAIAYDDIITNIDNSKLETMYKVNVFVPMMTTKYVIRSFLLNSIKGSIVHISSISAHTGYKGLAMYASTKGALEAFSKNTAREWGERGIRSNTIVAGFMETSMSSTLSNEQKDRIYKRTSLKRPTSLKSVAETVVFLLSDKSESITGENIGVNSGTI